MVKMEIRNLIVYVIFGKSYAFNLWRGKGLREGRCSASRAMVLATTLLVSFSLHLETIHEATFTVGDSLGWDFSVGSWTNGKQFKAKDMLIPSGDSLVIMGSTKDVIFKVDYTISFIGQEFGSVFLGDKNVALMVVSDGWVKVREQGQQKGDASPFLAELLHLEDSLLPFSPHTFPIFLVQWSSNSISSAFANANGLKLGFYHKTCPSIEAIVKETTARFISRAPTLAAPLIRMHFHDCFVRVVNSVLNLCQNIKIYFFLMFQIIFWWLIDVL
ncbi:hypothetical protein CsSME_00023752 [Camellia sinensis var. sinensis]